MSNNTVIKKLPSAYSLFTKMHVAFLYKKDTSPDRRILYAYSEGILYIPSALKLLSIESYNVDWDELQAYLPVWLYGGWAESKCESGVKYDICYGEMLVSSVVPRYMWP